MKKIILMLLICFSFGVNVYAAEEEPEQPLILEANEQGQVIVDEEISADGNTYILNDAKQGEEFLIEPNSSDGIMRSSLATTFNPSYNDGVLDKVHFDYSGSCNTSVFDNNTGTSYSLNGGSRCTLTFNDYYTFAGYYFYISATGLTIDFYKDDELLKAIRTSGKSGYVQHENIENVNKVVLRNASGFGFYFYEIEFFEGITINYEAVSNLRVSNIYNDSATVSYVKPDSTFFTHNEILLNGESVGNTSSNSYLLENLTAETEYEVTVRSYYTDGKYVDAITTFTTTKTPDRTPPGNVTNLAAKQIEKDVVLTFDLPTDEDFKSVRIARNGTILKSGLTENTFTDQDVPPNKEYTYKVYSIDASGNISSGATTIIKVVSKEIVNLTAKVDSYRVDLKWENPDRDDFEMVTIYRKENSGFALFSLFSETDGYTPLFETNGTTFNDLTVKPQTSYTYLLTTEIDGVESEGVTIDVTTKEVAVNGGDTETDENGDYVITWEQPNTGKILVSVGGEEYAIVNASDLKIIIPKEDMKFKLGLPDVTLTPLDENGVPIGEPSKPGGSDMGSIIGGIDLSKDLTADNLLLISVGLFGLVGMFVLLALAVRFVPKLLNIIAKAVKGGNRA